MPSTKSELPDFAGRYIGKGRLHLLDLLGAGAYGKVYKARDTLSPKSNSVFYAIKCMKKHEIGSRHDMHQKREFALHARASRHPNIITFFDVIEKGLFVYVILEVCTGDLHSAIVQKKIFYKNDELLKSAYTQILDAVEFCHGVGIYHRDLKPDNILCSDDGSRIFLADFGLATTVTACRDFGCGSMFYKSPESMGVFKQPTYAPKESDIWSLAVVLVNMITGRCPWRVAQLKDPSFQKAVTDTDYFCKTLPMSLGAISIVKGMFNLNPAKRTTIPEIRAALVDVDTFFLTDDELALASKQVRVVAAYFTGAHQSSSGLRTDHGSNGIWLRGFARLRRSLLSVGIKAPPQVEEKSEVIERHRAPTNTALFPPPRRILKSVVDRLKMVSGTSSSRSSMVPCTGTAVTNLSSK